MFEAFPQCFVKWCLFRVRNVAEIVTFVFTLFTTFTFIFWMQLSHELAFFPSKAKIIEVVKIFLKIFCVFLIFHFVFENHFLSFSNERRDRLEGVEW